MLILHQPAHCIAVGSYICDQKVAEINDSEGYACFSWYCSLDIYKIQLYGVHILRNYVSVMSLKDYNVQSIFLCGPDYGRMRGRHHLLCSR